MVIPWLIIRRKDLDVGTSDFIKWFSGAQQWIGLRENLEETKVSIIFYPSQKIKTKRMYWWGSYGSWIGWWMVSRLDLILDGNLSKSIYTVPSLPKMISYGFSLQHEAYGIWLPPRDLGGAHRTVTSLCLTSAEWMSCDNTFSSLAVLSLQLVVLHSNKINYTYAQYEEREKLYIYIHHLPIYIYPHCLCFHWILLSLNTTPSPIALMGCEQMVVECSSWRLNGGDPQPMPDFDDADLGQISNWCATLSWFNHHIFNDFVA